MDRILFVCEGNRCRSPMAEYLMKKLVAEAFPDREFLIESRGTDALHGYGAWGLAQDKLGEHGIECWEHLSRRLSWMDYDHFDYIICMDENNMDRTFAIFDIREDTFGKISLLLDHTDRKGEDIADPARTLDFDTAWDDISYGCNGLLQELREKYKYSAFI